MRATAPAAQRLRWRRARALLASGLVLGVGAAVTLAAWNDSEHSSATFTAGTFGIEGAVDGTSFSEHASQATSAAMTFPATPMAPGTTSFALFSVRTTSASIGGTAQLAANPGNSTGLGSHLTYGVRAIAGTTCDQSSFDAGAAVVPTGSPLTTSGAGTQVLQPRGAGTVHYCFRVTLPASAPNAAQGLALTARWEVVGTSS